MRVRLALGVVLVSIVCCAAYCLLWDLKVLPRTATGSRYVSWLPSFSVEVTRVRDAPLEDMVEQVLAVFPQYGRAAVLADLAHSRSPDLTVHNILEGRLAPPPTPTPAPAPPPAPATATVTAPTHDDDDSASSTPGASFSSTAAEREATLRRRKETLLADARRRYLARCSRALTPSPAPRLPPPARSPRS